MDTLKNRISLQPSPGSERVVARTGCSSLLCARGFTLIEVIIAVTILTILLMLAVPSMTALVRDQRVKAATFDVFATFAFARSEAIKRNADVVITPNAIDWGSGWQVQVGTTPLKAQPALSKISISGPAGVVAYQRDGRITGTTPPNFVVKSSDDSTITARCIRIDLSGRPIIKVDTNHNPVDGCQ
jgi:type IV fimbrial biogenesis protein FimT